ncbi:hypothetical protein BGZ60DRAFT_431600 [Tricladium varicosporioides]|nr:hypothetical protein BGZ60DRAFT_431600 [Hymenoscyphus varicosporioides]
MSAQLIEGRAPTFITARATTVPDPTVTLSVTYTTPSLTFTIPLGGVPTPTANAQSGGGPSPAVVNGAIAGSIIGFFVLLGLIFCCVKHSSSSYASSARSYSSSVYSGSSGSRSGPKVAQVPRPFVPPIRAYGGKASGEPKGAEYGPPGAVNEIRILGLRVAIAKVKVKEGLRQKHRRDADDFSTEDGSH